MVEGRFLVVAQICGNCGRQIETESWVTIWVPFLIATIFSSVALTIILRKTKELQKWLAILAPISAALTTIGLLLAAQEVVSFESYDTSTLTVVWSVVMGLGLGGTSVTISSLIAYRNKEAGWTAAGILITSTLIVLWGTLTATGNFPFLGILLLGIVAVLFVMPFLFSYRFVAKEASYRQVWATLSVLFFVVLTASMWVVVTVSSGNVWLIVGGALALLISLVTTTAFSARQSMIRSTTEASF